MNNKQFFCGKDPQQELFFYRSYLKTLSEESEMGITCLDKNDNG